VDPALVPQKYVAPFQGILSRARPAEILARLVQERASGELELKAGSVWLKLLLINGRAMASASNIGMEQLGEQLVRARILSRADLDRALRESPSGDAQLVDRLLKLSLVDPAILRAELTKNIQGQLEDVLGWSEGSFSFEPGTPEPPAVVPEVNLVGLVALDAAAVSAAKNPRESDIRRASKRPTLSDALEIARRVNKGENDPSRKR
jgi:hypothetical protein